MLSVRQAIETILDGVTALDEEKVGLDQLTGRIAAVDHLAQITQPPFAASAMDGYAVRFEDTHLNNELKIIGEVRAGSTSDADVELGEKEAIRIFTGSIVPKGADHVIIQEDVQRSEGSIIVTEAQMRPRNIRRAGVDFVEGAVLAYSGDTLNEIHGALFAAANLTQGRCIKKPTVAFFSNGDELKEPGSKLVSGEVINSNRYALSALIQSWGGIPIYLGCAPDNPKAIRALFEKANQADLIVPIGGASVGDYDFVRTAFIAAGGMCSFDKVAVRPSKPTWFGFLGASRVIGLPGNPASAIVGATLFVKPLIRHLGGHKPGLNVAYEAVTKTPLPANGTRETYLRACVNHLVGIQDSPSVTQYHSQDSSLLLAFGTCNALIRRGVNAPKAEIGERVDFIPLVNGNA